MGTLSFIFAKSAAAFTEVIFVETKKMISAIGTLVIVGVASAAGAALWTSVLDYKIKMVKAKREYSKSDKVIVIDFKKARRELGR